MANLKESDFAYLTENLQYVRKASQDFAEKVVSTLESVEAFEEAEEKGVTIYEALKKKKEALLKTLKESEDASAAIESFLKEIQESDAVGNLTALAEGLSPKPAADEPSSEPQKESEPPTVAEQVEASNEEGTLTEASYQATSDEPKASAPSDLESTMDAGQETTEPGESGDENAEQEHQTSDPVNVEVVSEDETEMSEALSFYKALVNKAEEAFELKDVALAAHNLDDIRFKWKDGPDVSEDEVETYRSFSTRFDEIVETVRASRMEHYDAMSKRRQENLERKKNIFGRLEELINKKRWANIGEAKSLKNKFDDIKNVPEEQAASLGSAFEDLFKTFEEKHVDFVVKEREREENNLQLKLIILDKLKLLTTQLDETSNWKKANEEVDNLKKQWRKVGRVTREKDQNIWNQYHKAIEALEDHQFEKDPKYRERLTKNLKKREALCEKAEALLTTEDLAEAAKSINLLHRDWKKFGPVPREHTEPLWERFKTASDAFNQRKADNADVLRDQEQENLNAKLAIIAKSQAILDEQDFQGGVQKMNALMDEWKNVGPVPKKKNKDTWKAFKTIRDEFYKNKRLVQKNEREEQKENLNQKHQVIEAILKLAELDDAQEAVNQIKPLQQQFRTIGFVPIKKKDKIYQQYKEACDLIYGKARATRPQGGSGRGPRQHSETNSLRREMDRLRDVILHYGDTMTFIKPNKQGLKLREDIQGKIDKAKEELAEKEAQLEEIRQVNEQNEESKDE